MGSNNRSVENRLFEESFENHLAFIGTHRGSVERGENGTRVHGDADFLSFWCGGSDPAFGAASNLEIRTLPWSGPEWLHKLEELGYRRSYALEYMVAVGELESPGSAGEISEVGTDAEAIVFASLQADGFLSTEDQNRGWWVNCFRESASRNYALSSQSFLISYVEGMAAAVMLTVDSGSCIGIYAMTTAPQYRGQGLSSSLLAHVVAKESSNQGRPIILQVEVGSYAERFYDRLGFEFLYRSGAYKKYDRA